MEHLSENQGTSVTCNGRNGQTYISHNRRTLSLGRGGIAMGRRPIAIRAKSTSSVLREVRARDTHATHITKHSRPDRDADRSSAVSAHAPVVADAGIPAHAMVNLALAAPLNANLQAAPLIVSCSWPACAVAAAPRETATVDSGASWVRAPVVLIPHRGLLHLLGDRHHPPGEHCPRPCCPALALPVLLPMLLHPAPWPRVPRSLLYLIPAPSPDARVAR